MKEETQRGEYLAEGVHVVTFNPEKAVRTGSFIGGLGCSVRLAGHAKRHSVSHGIEGQCQRQGAACHRGAQSGQIKKQTDIGNKDFRPVTVTINLGERPTRNETFLADQGTDPGVQDGSIQGRQKSHAFADHAQALGIALRPGKDVVYAPEDLPHAHPEQ